MRSLPLVQPRSRPGRCGLRVLASLTGLALLLPPVPVQAAAPATQACPTDIDAAPSSLALALKNAGQELRASGSFLRASQCFRNAVEELPDCATYADERLRWSLWAAEDYERAEPGSDGDLREFLERQVDLLGASAEGRSLTDYAQLVAARERLRQGGLPSDPGRPASGPPRQTRQVGLGLLAGGAPLIVTGAVLTGLFGVRNDRLSERLDALNREGNAMHCTAAPQPNELGRCADLRRLHDDAHDDRLAATRGLITGVTVLGVGAALVLAGLVTHLHGRRAARRDTSLRLLPAGAGLVLRGQF